MTFSRSRRTAACRKIYTSLDALQVDLDAGLTDYNETRPHQGRWCYGKTPMQMFLDSVPLAKEKLSPCRAARASVTSVRTAPENRRRSSFVATRKHADAERGRLPFSEEHLRILFNSPLYTGCASKARRTKSGELVIKDALSWVFPMTLYSGMRLEEAMGLRASDVRDFDGVLCFVVEPREDRPLKTATSRRVVPVH